MKYIKQIVIGGVYVEIRIEDTTSKSEKLYLLLEILKE